jgi:predicted DsbA family dithiol-disulfide isomerase
MAKLRIDVWSDVVCPWCYIGKRRLESALARFPHRAEVDIVWRAFELDPSAPRERDPGVPYAARLARKYGTSLAQAEARIARVTELAAAEGLDFRFEKARAGNTFDANRVIHLAGQRGVQGAVKERLLRGYFTEGEPVGDRDKLARLAGEAGLDPEEVRAALAGDAFAADVRRDEEEARDLGIDGVPFFVLAGRYGVSGAQPSELLLSALTQSWDDVGAGPASPASGPACGPDNCASGVDGLRPSEAIAGGAGPSQGPASDDVPV